MASKVKGSRKLGRNKVSCALYKAKGSLERNKKRRIAKEAKRVAYYTERNNMMREYGLTRSEAKVFMAMRA